MAGTSKNEFFRQAAPPPAADVGLRSEGSMSARQLHERDMQRLVTEAREGAAKRIKEEQKQEAARRRKERRKKGTSKRRVKRIKGKVSRSPGMSGIGVPRKLPGDKPGLDRGFLFE